MDPLASRLAKLSMKHSRRSQKKSASGPRAPASASKPSTSGAQSPASGLRTPASGLRTPASGMTASPSQASTPDFDGEFTSDEDYDEDEDEEEEEQPFRFFDLPYELRRKVLQHVMLFSDTVDLNTNAAWRTRMMAASRQFYVESCEAFYGTNRFRLLPLDGPVLKKKTRPLVSFFSPRIKGYLTKVELRLGPHWKDPPKCWQIDDKLGIEDMKSLRRLDVVVQCDPEHPSFNGFRRSKDFYTQFSGEILAEIIRRAPKLETVYIDSWPAVGRDSPLLRRLEKVTLAANKNVLWSSHLRLDCLDMSVHPADGVTVYDTVVVRQLIITD